MSIPIDSSWKLTFDEEFNGNTINTNVWGTNWLGNEGAITKPINSQELGAFDPAQVSVSGGYLHLNAIESPVTVNGKTYDYRSGIVQTYDSFWQTYGYFEARMFLPGQNGEIFNWPAFWLDGENWPYDGELDVMEGLGGEAAYHFHSPSGGPGRSVDGDYTGWHTFGALWEPGRVKFYYDNQFVGEITSGITDSPQFLILNLGIGINSIRSVPSEMLVDWVHAYSIDPSAVAVTPQPGYTGPGGNRVILGTSSDDMLRGTTAGDDIYGIAGNDTLIGGAGNNTLTGGAGDDRYYTQNLNDLIAEIANQGLDTVYATVNWTLSANTENLYVYGTATAGTGNSLANRINGLKAAQALTLDGGGGDDLIYGSNQSDTLIGGAGNDRLSGFGGANQMRGGLGDDIYYSRSAGDVLTEALDAGRDTLYSTVNVGALAANVECLTIYDGATLGVGNNLDNIISGKSSDVAVSLNGAAGNDVIVGSNRSGDILVGGSGNDRLYGMGGDDRFRFLAGSGADHIHGFDAVPAGGQDLIDVSGRGFTAASIGSAIVISTVGADTLITIGADTIRLFGVDAGSVTASDFVF